MSIWDLIAAIYTANANKPKDPKVTTATTPNEDQLFNEFQNLLNYSPARSYTDEYANQFLQGMNQPGSAAHYSPKYASPLMAGQTVPGGPTIDFNQYMPKFWRSDYTGPSITHPQGTTPAKPPTMPHAGAAPGGNGNGPKGPFQQDMPADPLANRGGVYGNGSGLNDPTGGPYQGWSDNPNNPSNPFGNNYDPTANSGYSFGQGGVILDASGKPVTGADGKPLQAVPWDGNTQGLRTAGNFVVNALGAIVGFLSAPNPITGAINGWHSADGAFHTLFGPNAPGTPSNTPPASPPPAQNGPIGGGIL